MSPSDKNKSTGNSTGGENQTQLCSDSCKMDFPTESTSSSTSNVTLSGQGTIINIPWVTAGQSTIKCSVNGQMKTFDPGEGEDGGIERLTSNNSGNSVFLAKSSSSLNKNSNKNYKAGSKINKLADMLAKRSQNVVEVKESTTSEVILDITSAPKVEEETVVMNSVGSVLENMNSSYLENTKNSNELKLFRKSRRKSVPNQSCGFQHWQLQQSTSKSCSDLSELFPSEENDKTELNALGGSAIKLQTDESTKKKVVRKNLRNVKLPLILPERKKRSIASNDSSISSKAVEKVIDDSSEAQTEILNKNKESPNESVTSSMQSTNHSVLGSKVKKESKMKQRKSRRLVESSTQTTDIEFISVIKPSVEDTNDEPGVTETEKPTVAETEKNSIAETERHERSRTVTYECLYCTQTFNEWSLCKVHEKTHAPRKYKQFRCQYCSKKLFSLEEFKNHCIQKHRNKYAYCKKCDFRFSTKIELYSHNKEVHLKINGESQNVIRDECPKTPSQETTPEDEEKVERRSSKNAVKSDLKIDVSFDSTKKSSVSPRIIQKCSPRDNKTEEQLLEMEMLFYSHLSGNIQENLTNHLDGKLDKSGIPVRTDQILESPDNSKNTNLLSVATPNAGVQDVQVLRAPSPYQTRSKTPNPLPPTAKKFKKLPNWQQKFWEKYNFPTNYRYEHRFWDKNYLNTEKSALYLKDLSCLDIKTQLTMRENIKKLDEIKKIEENLKPVDKLTFPDYLSLVPRVNKTNSQENKVDLPRMVAECPKGKKQTGKEETKKSFKSPVVESYTVKNRNKSSSDISDSRKTAERLKMMTRRQSSMELMKDDKEENSRKRKGSLDLSGTLRMALRRQTSLDNLGSCLPKVEKNEPAAESNSNNISLDTTPLSPTGSTEISGEWVRPRSYLCGTCCTKFTNLWELEDHKWVSHPNVWCTHYEFEDEKIEKLFETHEDDKIGGSEESPETSKSKLTDLYKRYLLPHGSLKTAKLVPKTNFPEQCTKCKKSCMSSSEMHKHMLDCGGDTTWFLTMYSSPMTIKRKWRPFGSRRKKQIGRRDVKRNIPSTPNLRSYQYQHRIRTKPGDVESIQKMLANLPEKRARRAINFDEIKTRSQATIHSNRLLRKRFKSTFSNNFLNIKTIKQKRQLKPAKKEGSSKSTTDTSSENTPVGSPKRRNKLKENLQLVKEENSRDGSSENSDVNVKTTKKKSQKKKESQKASKPKIKKEVSDATQEKPITRSNITTPTTENKTKRKQPVLKEALSNELENSTAEPKEPKPASKSSKKSKKKASKPTQTIKKETAEVGISNDTPNTNTIKEKDVTDKITKKIKAKIAAEVKPFNKTWVNSRCNPILRLKQSNKAKAELLKSMKKKVKNSKKILEKKEAESGDSGSRRSLRIKSQQNVENEPEVLIKKTPPESPKKPEPVFNEKDFKIKTVVVSLENAASIKIPNFKINNQVQIISPSKGTPKTVDVKIDKDLSEGNSQAVRRSLRNSISLEDKPETPRPAESSIFSFNPRSLLRRNIKTEIGGCTPPKTVEVVLTSTPPHLVQNNVENKVVTAQVSLLKKNNLQIPKPLPRVFQPEPLPELKRLDTRKCNDLEEMPVLAKVEPIRGKTFNKNEKEIPILMPVEKEQKRSSNDDIQVLEDSVSFQVIKKRRTNSKEITPLKIVKKIESVALEGGNGFSSSFRIENNDEPKDTPDGGKSKKKKLSDVTSNKTVDKKIKTDVKKYFLGIDPNEIDKGRKETQDESGSDNEPLICLVSNQSQSEEVGEVEKPECQVPDPPALEQNEEKKSENEVPILPCEKIPPVEIDKPILTSKTQKLKKKVKISKKKKKSNVTKELHVKVTLKEPKLKIIEKPEEFPSENKWVADIPEVSEPVVTSPPKIEEIVKDCILPERRSRRISKETKSTNEFVIDDPLILVDELWSDLDSDSDSSKRKSKKGKKKSPKKKTSDERKVSDVNLEELLRNFGENKETRKPELPEKPVPATAKIIINRAEILRSLSELRKAAENRKVKESYKRLSLKLFRFNKNRKNFGNKGVKLSDAKKALEKQKKLDELKSNTLPDLPFLAAEIKENPVQVIQCGAQKTKTVKKALKKISNADIHVKISLPLEAINNMPGFNNNHLTEPIAEEANQGVAVEPPQPEEQKEVVAPPEAPPEKVEEEPSTSTEDTCDVNKTKRSEVIDKIFYCEICKTYYYSSSQLKIHKLSNRHKLKESELLQAQQPQPETVKTEAPKNPTPEPVPVVEKVVEEPPRKEDTETIEKLNDDTLEMPVLEGPFIENPSTRPAEPVQPAPAPAPVSSFGFSQESLKDIQKAIGCTDEEMLILTLLGENTIEIESDILDLDACKSVQSKSLGGQKEKVESSKESEKAAGAFKVDLKQRMTSALACLVNKAVFNLLQKYETAAKTAVNPEALSLLGKLSNLSRRKNILQLNELLKKPNDGESSIGTVSKDLEKKEPTISYKYQCTICGSRFEKASTRECHISRSHRGKAKKHAEDIQATQTTHEEEWNDSWTYDTGDDHLGSNNTSQFWCSDCGINFLSPQEVLEHQKLEHQAGLKETEQAKDTGPLQSSTIGSSDEIVEGRKIRRRPKLFSSEELDQQRIIANNELRKLDRKFANKNKNNKIKWGMDALKFTVEKENKVVVDEEEKDIAPADSLKTSVDVKSIDLVPKLNLSRISNIPEFKVIQKNSFENRFQKIIDNKLKRKCVCPQEELATDEVEEEVMLVPVVVKKKSKKQKLNKGSSKKGESGKPLDVYDFNESESEGEPAVYSHIKKPAPSPTKLKLVKVKEGPSKNKADSTTKDLAPDDYDSEDSLPLSVVKKSKPGEEDDEKDEKVSDDGVEKSDGILEQVEYLIEQLENETGPSKNENLVKTNEFEQDLEKVEKSELSKDSSENSVFTPSESLRVSVANKFLEMDELPLKNQKIDKEDVEEEKLEESREQESFLAEPESSQSTFDEEDSIPLVLISKKADKPKFNADDKNTTDVSTTGSEDVNLIRPKDTKSGPNAREFPNAAEESLPSVFSSSENDGAFSEKSDKPFETLNGNVIYCRNDSMTDFESDLSTDGLIDSSYEKTNSRGSEGSFIKEITEKDDVVIVCSKRIDEESLESKTSREFRNTETEIPDNAMKKKKRFPLLSATIEENNFRRSESPKSNKEVIVRKIWSRKKLAEESTDNDEDSRISTFMENFQEDESQTEIEKEIIVKKIWSRKKFDLDEEFPNKMEEKFEDIRINQTEISDEVVIKCGPKAKSSPKRRKSKSSNEASKDTIMRKIWSGRCTFQTKAALKTYDSDVLPDCKENEISGKQSKRKGRSTSMSPKKRSKVESDKDDDDDDLDSLLEEIEREQLEKAIRSEFLQLRRSEKASVEMKEGTAPTVGIFTETTLNPRKELTEKKRRKIKKKIKHPEKSILKRKKIIRKPFRRVVLPSEDRNFRENSNQRVEPNENSLEKSIESLREGTKSKNRKHKKHRHKHHHHKHKHKKSKHHKSEHKSKREFEERAEDSFTILEKICQKIPSQIENESESRNEGDPEKADTFSLESKTEEGPEALEFENGKSSSNVYEFVEDGSDFSRSGIRDSKK